MMRSTLQLLALAVLTIPHTLALAQQNAPGRGLPGDEVAREWTLPTRQCGHFFTVQTMINGAGPFWMLLDTGASITTLSAETARAAQVDDRIRSVEMGDLKVTGHLRSQTKPLAHIEDAIGFQIDGILGHRVFQRVLLTYDFPAGEVRYRLGELGDDLPGIAPMSTSKRPFIGAYIGDEKVNILLDTGYGGFLALEDFESLPFAAPPAPVGLHTRLDEYVLKRQGRLRVDVRFGSFRLEEPIVENAAKSSLLGQGILSRFVVTIDQQRGRVQMVLPDGSALADPIISAPSTGLGFAPRAVGDRLQVERVFAGTPAEAAGLARGDEIVRVNGEVWSAHSCGGRRDGDAQRPVVLLIERAGEQLELELEPAVLVP